VGGTNKEATMTDFIPTDEAATRREDGLVGWDGHGPIFAAPEPAVISRLLAAADGNPWWPRAGRSQLAPADGGSILDGYGPKGLWHTTETSGWPGYATGFFPHLTVGLVDGRFSARQHIPFNRAARALRNESGGVQTNRTGVKQVEIIARADTVDVSGLPAALEDGLAEWAAWLKAEWGVPMTCSVTFKEYPASYGKANGVRLSGSAWESYAGWCGHQHAPENDHGDPGRLDWHRILRTQGDLTMADAQAILTAIAKLREDLTVFGTRNLDETVENIAQRQRDTLTKLDALTTGVGARLDAIEELLTGSPGTIP
jgi:hypothetical protein